MKEIRRYIVRIYRQEGASLSGLVESVEGGTTAPFRSTRELCAVLTGAVSVASSRQRKPKPGAANAAPRRRSAP